MKLTKNEHLVEVNGKLEGCDPSSLTSLASANKSALTIFGSRIGGVLDGTSDDGWHDKVRTGITTAMQKIQGFITEEQKSCDFIEGGVGPVTNLKTIVKEYVTEFDNYAAIADSPPTRYVQENGSDKVNENGSKTQTNEYTQWAKKVHAYEIAIPQLETEAKRLENAVRNYFAAIDLTTHTIDGSVYHEGDGDIRYKFADLFRKLAEIPDDEWVKIGDTETEYDPTTGQITTKEKFEVHKDEPDGSHIDAEKKVERTYQDINGDGKVDETDQLIYEKVHTEGTYTDPEGKQWGFVQDTESDTIGIVKDHKEVTDKETNEVVQTEDYNREAAYDDATGATTVEATEVVESKDTNTKTETRTIDSSYGDQPDEQYQEKVTITTPLEDDGTGTVEHEDGSKTIVYRDESGQLCSREEYQDKNGKTQTTDNGPLDPPNKKKVTITYPEGHEPPSKEMTVDINNPIDQQRVQNEMENARSEYYVAGSGCGPRWIDLEMDGHTEVSGCMPGNDTTISIDMTDAE